jgi:GntR family transcriptional regulator, vanillate catabolism transcriptional regulator
MQILLPEALDEFRLDVRLRLVDQVTHVLREMILSHKIPAGSRLVQTELADRLGVSRTPLREAIRVLEQDGLLRVSDGNRTVEVVSFSGDDLVQLYEIREVIDGLAARLLARRGLGVEADKEISDHLRIMSKSVLPLKGEAFFTAHTGFHSAILIHSGNARLRGELQLVRMTAASLRDEFPRQLRTGGGAANEAKAKAALAIAKHEAIYDAIRRGDEDLAEQVARYHIRQSFDLIPR